MINKEINNYFDTLYLADLLSKLVIATRHAHYCPCACYCFEDEPFEYSKQDVINYILQKFKENYD